MLKGKKVLIGITASIAAYKAILLVRLLVTKGAEVRVVITPAAKDFVSPLTLSTLSKNPVLVELADADTWANHVMLGRWADLFIVAPLTCNTLAKMATGLCDNLLLATYLSATCPVLVAPAMDEDMWKHPAIIKNLETLKHYGHYIIPVGRGELASGLFGEGRMAEPADIIAYIEYKVFRDVVLKGKKALVTAGPTYEMIDPVRFVGNHSSGKMGIAIAQSLHRKGADVTLVIGPTSEPVAYPDINVIRVTSAEEMYNACMAEFSTVQIAVMAAAVADYTPAFIAEQKIKKQDQIFNLELKRTQDILATLGKMKNEHQLVVGFALETDREEENAIKKLTEKNADLIVLNSLKDANAGFKKDTNKVSIFDRLNNVYSFEAKSKILVAEDIVHLIISKLYEKL